VLGRRSGAFGGGLRGGELGTVAGSNVDGQQTVAAQPDNARTALDLVTGQQVTR